MATTSSRSRPLLERSVLWIQAWQSTSTAKPHASSWDAGIGMVVVESSAVVCETTMDVLRVAVHALVQRSPGLYASRRVAVGCGTLSRRLR